MKILRIMVSAAALVLVGTSVCIADCTSGARYHDNGNGTVTDCKSSLVWLKDANCHSAAGGVKPDSKGRLSWNDAVKWVAGLRSGLCGLKDGSSAGAWRLPTKIEWEAMVADAKNKGYSDPSLTNAAGTAEWTNGDAFNNVQLAFYWSSTMYDAAWNPAGAAWGMTTIVGNMSYGDKAGHDNVWPVRNGP